MTLQHRHVREATRLSDRGILGMPYSVVEKDEWKDVPIVEESSDEKHN